MSEFIGSRISLISKSDIKYVGTLHEINSETSTVALEQVRSYGTEGRRGNPDEEIPPNDQIYDYIVFRGSDVKDLTIVEPPKESKPQMPNDPAILGAARPHPGAPGAPGPQGVPSQPQQQQQQQQQQQSFQQPPPNSQWRGPNNQPPPFPPYGYPPPPQQNSRFAPPGGPHGFPGGPGAPPPGYGMQYGPPPGWFPPGPPGQGFPQGPPGPFPQSQQPIGPPGLQNQNQQQQKTPGPAPQQPAAAPDSGRPTPPANNDTKPSTAAQPPANAAAAAPTLPVESKPDIAAATAPAQQSQQKPAPTGPKNNRVALPLASPHVNRQAPVTPLQAKSGNAPASQPSANNAGQSATQAAAAAVAAAMAKLGPVQGAPAATGDRGVDNLTKKVGEMRTDDRIRNSRQPGTGGFAAGRGGRGGRRPSTREHTKPVEVPTTDFDFEGSNAKFNKQDMVKEAIATGSPMGTPTVEHDITSPAQNPLDGDDNGVDVNIPSSEADVVIPSATYNKSNSFFDNISSELKDRNAAQEEGKRFGGPEFRNQERSKNMETFGQGSVDNGFRGGYRGRGRGRGFGGRGRGFAGGRGGFVPRGGAGPIRGSSGGNTATEA